MSYFLLMISILYTCYTLTLAISIAYIALCYHFAIHDIHILYILNICITYFIYFNILNICITYFIYFNIPNICITYFSTLIFLYSLSVYISNKKGLFRKDIKYLLSKSLFQISQNAGPTRLTPS